MIEGKIMRRDCPVWIEAYQAYLERNCTKEEQEKLGTMYFNKMSDEEISELFCQYVKENGIEKEARRWVYEYCRQWM
ncbi:MAG: hypothetical protein J1F28_08800 [Oscillospiraceae bacterium]|nr:hypothetical protein [Oscillospiraceae bacterium]